VTDSDGGGRVRVGGEAKLVVVLGFKRGIQTVTIRAVGEYTKLKLSTPRRRMRGMKLRAVGEGA